MLSAIVRFSDDAAALEKTLRLLQSFCTIAIGVLGLTDTAAPWVVARTQFALGRRYFRLLKWHPAWKSAYRSFNQDQVAGRKVMDVIKWSFLGAYFFLEMLTISNALRVTNYEWGPQVQREANKCWLYSLAASVLVSLYDLIMLSFAGTPSSTPDVKKGKDISSQVQGEKSPTPRQLDQQVNRLRSDLYRQIVIDSVDMFIPGAAVGWIPVGPVIVGTASAITSTLAGQQIWDRVQQKALHA